MKKEDRHYNGKKNAVSRWKVLVASFTAMMICGSCTDDNPSGPTPPSPVPTENEAAMILKQDKLDMIYSLVDLEGNKGRIYEMNYTVDYKLDEALNFGIDGTERLKQFVALNLMDTIIKTKGMALSYDAGCSAFACPDKSSGDYLMGRNFDFNHRDKETNERVMIPVIAVHTAPKGGKKSVSFVDGQFVDYKQGFYNDGETDLSMLMALPYLLLDGINEDGFAISVLKLDGLPTRQVDSTKKTTFTTVAMRMLLDRAGSVNEALEMLDKYNMCMDKDTASYHFFMADAKGDYAIVEYTNPDTLLNPCVKEVLRGVDTLRYVTNFYVSPTMKETPHGSKYSSHGKRRYNDLKEGLTRYKYNVTYAQALGLMQTVAQGPDEEPEKSTGFTQWTEIYNLSKKRLTMNILREWGKTFEFGIE